MFRHSSLHVEVQPWSCVITGLAHGPHHLKAGDVEDGADEEHDNIKREILVSHHGVGCEVESIDSHDHVSVEHQGFCILLQDLSTSSGSFFSFLFSKCFHNFLLVKLRISYSLKLTISLNKIIENKIYKIIILSFFSVFVRSSLLISFLISSLIELSCPCQVCD